MAVKIQPKCPRAIKVLAWVISRVITMVMDMDMAMCVNEYVHLQDT